MITRALIYSIKVWITAVLVGPFALELLVALMHLGSLRADVGWSSYLLWFWMYGGLFSIPSALLLWVVSFFVCRTSWAVGVKRIWIAAASVPLVVLSLLFLTGGHWKNVQDILFIEGVYYLVIIAGVLFYRLPGPDAALS